MPIVRTLLVAAAAFAAACTASAQQGEVLWLGHATFRITSPTGKVIVIDPFLKTNPRTPAQYKDLAALGKVDLILVTHGHRDHIVRPARAGEAHRRDRRRELRAGQQPGARWAARRRARAVGMNKGGTVIPLGPGIKIHMVPAEHSSSVDMTVMKPGLRRARASSTAARRSAS